MEWLTDLGNNVPGLWLNIGAVFGTAIIALIGLAATEFAGTQAWAWGRKLVREIKGHRAEIIAAVDDATDPLPLELGTRLGIPPEVVSDLFEGILKIVLKQQENANEAMEAGPKG